MKRINIKWILVGISMHICACKEAPTENKTEQSSENPEEKRRLVDVEKVSRFYFFSDEEIASLNQDDQLKALGQNTCVSMIKIDYKYIHPRHYIKEWRHEKDTFDPVKNLSNRAKKRLAKEFLEDEYEKMKKETLAYAKRYHEAFKAGKYPWYHAFKVAYYIRQKAGNPNIRVKDGVFEVDPEILDLGKTFENDYTKLKREVDNLTEDLWYRSQAYKSEGLKESYNEFLGQDKTIKTKVK